MSGALIVAQNTGYKFLLGIILRHRARDYVSARIFAVKLDLKLGSGILLTVSHYFLANHDSAVVSKHRASHAIGRINTLYLRGFHLKISAVRQLCVSGGIHYILTVSITLAVMLLDIFHLSILRKIEGMYSAMLGLLRAAVVDTAARNYRNVAIAPDMKVVINQLLDPRL